LPRVITEDVYNYAKSSSAKFILTGNLSMDTCLIDKLGIPTLLFKLSIPSWLSIFKILPLKHNIQNTETW